MCGQKPCTQRAGGIGRPLAVRTENSSLLVASDRQGGPDQSPIQSPPSACLSTPALISVMPRKLRSTSPPMEVCNLCAIQGDGPQSVRKQPSAQTQRTHPLSALCESSNQLDLRLQRKSANTGRTVASDVDGNVGICPFKPVAGTTASNSFVLRPVLRQTSPG